MRRLLLSLTALMLPFGISAHTVSRYTDTPAAAIVPGDFVAESQMQADLLQMLADFSLYMKNDFQEAQAPNSIGEQCGCFRGENTMANDERGVRPNADLSMICAFLAKYGKGKVTLPQGVTWTDIESMAMKSLVFAYSTHKANKPGWACRACPWWRRAGRSLRRRRRRRRRGGVRCRSRSRCRGCRGRGGRIRGPA